MPAIVSEIVFSEPSGRAHALVQFCGALAFAGLYGHAVLVEHATPGLFLPVMAVGFALSGVAESLPTSRRRASGVFRVSAMVVMVALLGTMAVAPSVVSG
jgi:hypothetical protein